VKTAADAARAVAAWNECKRRMFSAAHVAVAWRQLADEGWIHEMQARSAVQVQPLRR
jgi:hypothetical protein